MLGSGSAGNALYFESTRVRLLVDAGFSCKKMGEKLEKIERDLSSIDAIVVTHEHIDHCRGISVIAKKYKIPLYMNEATFHGLPEKIKAAVPVTYFVTGSSFNIHDLIIETFSIPHDAADPVGIIVKNDRIKITTVTDLGYVTHLVRERVKGSDALIVESNHDREMLIAGPYPWSLKQRVQGKFGHLSNEECGDLLQGLLLEGRLKNVVLAHVSEKNNHPDIARISAQDILSKTNVTLSVAKQHTVGDFYSFNDVISV